MDTPPEQEPVDAVRVNNMEQDYFLSASPWVALSDEQVLQERTAAAISKAKALLG